MTGDNHFFFCIPSAKKFHLKTKTTASCRVCQTTVKEGTRRFTRGETVIVGYYITHYRYIYNGIKTLGEVDGCRQRRRRPFRRKL